MEAEVFISSEAMVLVEREIVDLTRGCITKPKAFKRSKVKDVIDLTKKENLIPKKRGEIVTKRTLRPLTHSKKTYKTPMQQLRTTGAVKGIFSNGSTARPSSVVKGIFANRRRERILTIADGSDNHSSSKALRAPVPRRTGTVKSQKPAIHKRAVDDRLPTRTGAVKAQPVYYDITRWAVDKGLPVAILLRDLAAAYHTSAGD